MCTHGECIGQTVVHHRKWIKPAFHDMDINTDTYDSPDTPTSLCPTRAIPREDVGVDIVECGPYATFWISGC